MVKVKMCGMRRPQDIGIVNEVKPDFIGFILSKSKRQVSIEEAGELAKAADDNIKKAGIFVNMTLEFVLDAAKNIPLDVIQLHGDESQEYIDKLRIELNNCGINSEIWKAVGIASEDDIQRVDDYKVDGILLDSKVEGNFGGTGKAFDWTLIKNFGNSKKIILAGGLNKDNVAAAIKLVKPYAVDVSSGIEVEGFKNIELCRKFMGEVDVI